MNLPVLPATSRSKIFLVEDHQIVRKGLALLINHEADLMVCGEATDADGARRGILAELPDLVVLDLTLVDGLTGLQLIKDLRKSGFKAPILVLSMHDESVYAERAINAGAQGYVMKAEATELLLVAIRKMICGGYFLSDQIVGRVLLRLGGGPGETVTRNPSLTDREVEVLHLLGQGKTTREIAASINLSVKTIESYREHLKEKLELKNSAELVHYAVKWVETQV